MGLLWLCTDLPHGIIEDNPLKDYLSESATSLYNNLLH